MPRFRPALEPLESRLTPAGSITTSFANGTWTIVGDDDANSIVINPTATANKFTVAGLDGETFTGATTRGNVTNIVVKMAGGADRVVINDTGGPMKLAGALNIQGGDDANTIEIDRLKLQKSLKVSNGTASTGGHVTNLSNSKVSGSVSASSVSGNTHFTAWRDTAGDASSIGGNLTVTNGVGEDKVDLLDTNIGGNVTVHNGEGSALDRAGRFWMYNNVNDTSRSVVSGNVKVTYLTGEVTYDGMWDTDVKGNVTLDHGSGTATTRFDGYSLALPTRIRGNLTIRGTGEAFIAIGQSLNHGLSVGKNLNLITGDLNDFIESYLLKVGLTTTIQTGGGADTIDIDDSVFLGPLPSVKPLAFLLDTGSGNDIVNIDTADGWPAATVFGRAARIDLGSDDDTLTLGEAFDADRRVEHKKKITFRGGDGNDTLNQLNLVSLNGAPVVTADFETVVAP
jgi:hypothetical protein